MALDDPTTVLYYLREMRQAGSQAHGAAGEEVERIGWVRDMIFGLNTAVDALIGMVESEM